MCGVFLKYYVRYWFFHSALFVSQELIGNNSFQIITPIILLCDFLSDDLILCFILFYSCYLVISFIYIPEINVDIFLISLTWKANKRYFIFICVKSCSSLASHSLICVHLMIHWYWTATWSGNENCLMLHRQISLNLLMLYTSFYLVSKKAPQNWRMYYLSSVYSLYRLMLDNKKNIPDFTASKIWQKVGQQGRQNDHKFSKTEIILYHFLL